MLFNLSLLILSSIILAKSASLLVSALSALSRKLGLSEFSVSFVIMSIVTTLPELIVGVSSAWAGIPTLSLGNVLGSNIADLTLIISIPIILSGGIMVRSLVGRRDALYMTFFALTPLVLLWDKELGRGDAVILLILYGIYIVNLLTTRKTDNFSNSNQESSQETLKWATFLITGVALLLISGQVIVFTSKNLAGFLNIPVSLVGLLLVAVGTSLPELAFGLKAVKLHHQGLILGNILGSVVANSTLILATTSLLNPIVIQDFSLIFSSSLFLVLTLLFFLYGVYTDKKLDVTEGIALLFLYIFFLIAELGLELLKVKGVF